MDYTFRFAPVLHRSDLLLEGLAATLWISAVIICLGFTLGVLGALASRSRLTALRRAVAVYVEAIRNTPLLAQLFFVYFGLAGLGLRIGALTGGIVAMVIYLGAYVTEIVRGGIDAVPCGQTDAGLALGLRKTQVFFLIVLKPALKIMFPALASQFTLIILATSILSQIGVVELFHMAGRIDADTFRSFEVYAVVCGMYLGIAILFRAGCALLYLLLFSEHEPRVSASAVAPT